MMKRNSQMEERHGLSLPVTIQAVDRVEITVLMDNYVDVLLGNTDVVTRPVFRKGDEISRTTVVAEHGLSMLVRVSRGDESHSILFDTGYTEIGVPHNLRELEIDLKSIEAIVLSHGHMDHTGALYPVLKALSRPMPLVVHPWAFHSPRLLKWPDGRVDRFPDTLIKEDLKKQGCEILESQDPVSLAGGMILVTGEIERKTPFEKGFPLAKIIRDGELVPDPIRDDQALVVHLKGRGLVVISGCAHSGIVNTVLYSRKITGIEPVYAILGGFHLSGPLFEPIIGDTIAALTEIGPKVLVPMHCTGWKAINHFSESFPDAFVLNSVGSKFVLS
jgi:7,8-dihydropterin-6-yl-methyl-4-(beta-D-ribofuranosyl)aminobenzene 5'-phosphate synthase